MKRKNEVILFFSNRDDPLEAAEMAMSYNGIREQKPYGDVAGKWIPPYRELVRCFKNLIFERVRIHLLLGRKVHVSKILCQAAD